MIDLSLSLKILDEVSCPADIEKVLSMPPAARRVVLSEPSLLAALLELWHEFEGYPDPGAALARELRSYLPSRDALDALMPGTSFRQRLITVGLLRERAGRPRGGRDA